MELLLINHPLDCPVCDKGGECPLQNQAMSNGRAESRFEDVKRTYPKPIHISTQVLLDRERCVLCARCTRFSEQIAGDPFIELLERGALQQVGIYEDEAVRVLLLRQHRADLPGRRADRRGLPVPRPPVRPGVHARASASTAPSGCALRTDHRRGTVAAPAGRRRPGGQRGVELRQGPLGLHATPRAPTGSPRRWCATTDGELQAASWPEALDAAAPRPGRRPRRQAASACCAGGRLTARGRLRLRQVRPRRARHQRRRLPRPPALGRGGGVPRQPRRRHRRRTAARSPTPTSSGARPVAARRASSPRRSRRSSSCGCARRSASTGPAVYAVAPFATRGLDKLRRHARPAGARHRGRGPRGARRRRRRPGRGRRPPRRCAGRGRGRPRRRAAGRGARRAVRGRGPGRRAPAPAWPGCPRRAGERGARRGRRAARPAARRPPGRRRRRPRRRRRASGASSACPTAPGRDTAGDPRRRRAPASSARCVVGGVDPADLPDPPRPLAALDAARSSSASRSAPARSPSAPTSCCPVAAAAGEGRHVRRLGGPRPALRGRRCATNAMTDHRVLDLLADEMGEHLGLRTVDAARAELAALGAWHGRARRGARPRRPREVAAARRRARPSSPPGTSCSTPAACRTASRSSPAPRRGRVARLSAATAAEVGVADGDLLTVATGAGAVTLPVAVTEMADHVVWLPTNSPGSAVRAAPRRRRRRRRHASPRVVPHEPAGLGSRRVVPVPMLDNPTADFSDDPWWLVAGQGAARSSSSCWSTRCS